VAFYFLADLHGITTPYDPKSFPQDILKTETIYLALGLDPQKATLFLQSLIPAHSELAWLFQTITPVGDLTRMTQYKDKIKKDKAPAMSGLLSYPVLMAADILLYKAEAVPVGEDQAQHVEITREIASRFNKKFGKVFPLPNIILPAKEAARIKSLQDPTKKMSKSDKDPNGTIDLLDSPDEIRRKLKIAVTDSGKEVKFDPKKKPALSNLLTIASGFSGKSIPELEKEFSGKGYGEFKTAVAEYIVAKLEPFQNKVRSYKESPHAVREILERGSSHAQTIASQTLKEVKEKMGLML
jgi:tryptophanyl-tRNA synthetase